MPLKSKEDKKDSKYLKITDIEHVLLRPEVYIDSVTPEIMNEWIFSDEFKLVNKPIQIAPALIRIFIEPLSNAIDNIQRSINSGSKTKCTVVKVNIDKNTGETTVYNDGDVIPVEMHDEYKIYNHTLLFSQMRTSSNYIDSDVRENVSGRNGMGVKATACLSSFFQVRGFDPNNSKLFTQKWNNNLSKTDGPNVVVNKKLKTGFTEVKYIPDFIRFGIDGYTDDIINLYKRFVVDCCIFDKDCKIYFNDELLSNKIKNLNDYSKLYEQKIMDEDEEDNEEDLEKTPTKNKRRKEECVLINYKGSEVLLQPSNGVESICISFANRIFTSLGGVHVKAWYDALLTPILKKINKKGTQALTLEQIKHFFKLFVISTVVNPKYDNQCKRMLKSPTVETEVKPKDIKDIMDWKIIEKIQNLIDMKNNINMLNKINVKKTVLDIEGLELCDNAKGKNGYKCMLAICEGKSAKTFIMGGRTNGIEDLKADSISVFPIKGKLLNTRKEKPTKIASSEVITNLIKIIGIKQNLDYTDDVNFKTLRHGKILIVVDQDTDGTHIMGLFINFIEHLFPSILKRKEPFIVSLQTPLVRVESKPKDLLFYDIRQYEEYVLKQGKKKVKAVYYKGIGGVKNKTHLNEIFGKKLLELKHTNETTSTLNKVFSIKNADNRKAWMKAFQEDDNKDECVTFKSDSSFEKKSTGIDDYINKTMIYFSIEDCERSIPGLDGLKESQRKVLYGCFKRKLNYTSASIKVFQLGGYVAEHTDYHHGDSSMNGTIINLAQFFVGANNIPLLKNDGQFGTRLGGGKDHASARYIDTGLEELTRNIFIDDDDHLLTYKVDGDSSIEPVFYVPIIPFILVNGAQGMGTGWSTNIPQHNPLDIIKQVRNWIDEKQVENIDPWYYGFKGTIEKIGDNKYNTHGIITRIKEGKQLITELPIGEWTNRYKERLTEMYKNQQIKDFTPPESDTDVNIIITETKDGLICNKNNMKLINKITTTNMVMFDEKGIIRKFNSTSDIISHYCPIRLEYYVKRIEYMIKTVESELVLLRNKQRFIEDVIENKIIIQKRNEHDISIELDEKKFEKVDGSFAFLLSLQLRTLTKESVEKIKNDVQAKQDKLDELKSKDAKEFWIEDLDCLENKLPIFYSRKERDLRGKDESEPKERKRK